MQYKAFLAIFLTTVLYGYVSESYALPVNRGAGFARWGKFTHAENEKPQYLYFGREQSESNKNNDEKITQVKKYLEKDRGKEALKILRTLPQNYDVIVLTARSYATLDNPVSALEYYYCALKLAKNHEEREVAYFGIAKMLFWVDKYISAKNVYKNLLYYPLNKEDCELARAGVVKSLAYADRTRTAYCAVPKNKKFTTQQMVVAAAQASLWSGWPDLTRRILCCCYPDITCKIDPKSPLGRDIKDIKWQLNLATARNDLSPTFYFSSDSEDFIKRDYRLDYSRYWSQCWQSFVGLDRIVYTQNSNYLAANGMYVKQTWQPTRDLIFSGRLQPMNYDSDGWHPFLWGAVTDYIPNDIWHFQLLAQKEIVETFPAFNNHIADNLYVVDVKFSPFPYFQIDASTNRLDFTDSNVRKGYFLSAALLLSAHIGLTVEARQREYTDDFKSPAYFSPARYKEDAVSLRLGRKLTDTWRYYLLASRGRQTITSTRDSAPGSSPTTLVEGGINGPITNCIIFNASYGWAKQASAFIDSTDYSYQYGAISLNFLF